MGNLVRLGLFFSLALSVFGQTFGDLSGEVRDASGAIVAGAKVSLLNSATGATRDTVTSEAGTYAFPSLQPGSYTMKVEKAGF
jgi:hypothetical protein